MVKSTKLKEFLNIHGPTITLISILVVFTSYVGFMALNLQRGIVPDEPAHFNFAKYYSTTLKIPPDTFETYSLGWYIKGNPFLYYWISGRIINLINFILPNIQDSDLLITLRLVSVFYSLGTIVFLFLLSKEIIQHRWWQLLPSFLLTNTLMFVFISAGVTYDNLANLLSMAALYFLVRVFKHNNFVSNSLAWMIFIALGSLVKYTILPLALAMTIAWLVFVILNRKEIFPLEIKLIQIVSLSIILILLLLGNFAIYGVNLIQYQSITPACREILLESQCEISRYEIRHQELALDSKLSIADSISEGYPSPIRYLFYEWEYHILLRTFGLSGHKAFFPYQLITYYQFLFYSIVILGLLNLFIWKSFSIIDKYLLFISAFYSLVVFITNYNSELVYGFRQVAIQGRYLFPIVGAIVILFAKTIKGTPVKIIQNLILAFTLGLIFLGGPLTILLNFNRLFSTWFM